MEFLSQKVPVMVVLSFGMVRIRTENVLHRVFTWLKVLMKTAIMALFVRLQWLINRGYEDTGRT